MGSPIPSYKKLVHRSVREIGARRLPVIQVPEINWSADENCPQPNRYSIGFHDVLAVAIDFALGFIYQK